MTVESPGFPESVTEGQIQFLKRVGDIVTADERIAYIEIPSKGNIEVNSPINGVIEAILVPNESEIKAHIPIIKLRLSESERNSDKGGTKMETKALQQASPQKTQTIPPSQSINGTRTPAQTVASLKKEEALDAAPSKPPPPKHSVTPFVASSDTGKIIGTRAETRVISFFNSFILPSIERINP